MEILMNKIGIARIATQEEIKGITSWPAHLIGDEHPEMNDDWTTEFFILKIEKDFIFKFSSLLKESMYESEELDRVYLFPENQDLLLVPFEPLCAFITAHVLNEHPEHFTRYFVTNLGYDEDSLLINGKEIEINPEDVGGFIQSYDLINILL